MRLNTLVLEDFRNYQQARVDLAPGTNVLVGRNAQGKTNLLEAIHCLSGLGSPRGPDAALVRRGADRALLHAGVSRGNRSLKLDLELRTGRANRALINGTALSSARELAGVLACVFFGPDELALIKGGPERRRRLLDDLVVKLRPARQALRREWERVLKQRNALLKSWPAGSRHAGQAETLRVWDEAFTRAGAALAVARLEALAALAPYVQKRYEAVAGGGRCELSYASAWLSPELCQEAALGAGGFDEAAVREALAAQLDALRQRELERGVGLVGPQRDDVTVLLTSVDATEPLEARAYASQGDQRTAALAVRLAEHDLVTDTLGDTPVLLLDDVFSELDPARRDWLAQAVRGVGQAVITSAEPDAAAPMRAEIVIEVMQGKLFAR